MHSTQCICFLIIGNIALNGQEFDACVGEFSLAETAGEVAALIFNKLGLDKMYTGDFCFQENHERTLSFGMGITKRPPQSATSAISAAISLARFQGRIRT